MNAVVVGILSLGCPKNLVDSEVLLGILEKDGFSISYDVTKCDIALINTCAFIDDAKQESLDMIHELCMIKKDGHIKHLVVCGCLPQRYPDGLDDIMSEIDGYVGAGEIESIAEVIRAVLANKPLPKKTAQTAHVAGEFHPRFYLTPTFVKYIKIAEGCDHACAFCTIPRIRGKYRSRSIESIVSEVEVLVRQGLKEAVLVAQDTSYYGHDIYGELRLADLLHELAQIKGLDWIRTLYMYPRNVTDELIDVFNAHDNICKYMDLSLQHINNDILKKMHRGITKERIIEVITKVRERMPSIALRTTFIVGYPGEGYKEFNELLDFVEEMKFERMGAFIYSQEEGTYAATLPNQVDDDIQKSRFQDIMLLQQKISRDNNSRLLHKTFKTLIEGQNPDRVDYFIGRTYMDAPEVDGLVYVKKKNTINVGEFYNVKITDTSEYDLVGEVTYEK